MSNNQLPADEQERIKADAKTAAKREEVRLKKRNIEYGRMVSQIHGYTSGYIAGATAENAHNESVRLQLEAQNANVEILLSQKKDITEKAQVLVDTLRGCIGTIIFWYEVLSQTEGFGIMEAEYLEAKNQSIKRIETALRQWKGEGKEVGK